MTNHLVRDIGEQGLLKQLQQFCASDIVGDDGAVLSNLEPGHQLVVTTDVLVDGVHFSDRTTAPEDVGWRAIAVNLSDLAAMGASPIGVTIGLSLPGTVAVSWVKRLYQGMSDCLEPYHTAIVGGDICRSPVITLSITAFGQVLPKQIIRRSTAQVGDAILVTGIHGASRMGLELLLNPDFGNSLSENERSRLIQSHQRPKPRLDILPHLWEILLSQSPIPLTGMDSSDGLADAIAQICRASRVGAVIERNAIPIPSLLPQLVDPEQLWDWVLYGGEDFELVLCLSEPVAQVLVTKVAARSAIIGYITSSTDVLLTDSTGTHTDELLTLSRGFQHF